MLPPRFDSYLTTALRLSAAERMKLLAGSPITRFLETDYPSKEIAIFGALWIDAPRSRYVEAVKDIERFESGASFNVTKRISSPPIPEDFTELQLPKEDVADMRRCRVGNCKVKLSQLGIENLRSGVDWTKPTAEAIVQGRFRDLAYAYVMGYLERGNEGLAVYRDSARPTFVADEFSSMIDRMPGLIGHLPEVRRYLLEYPDATLLDSSEFFYWQEARFGLKPTIRMNHVIIKEGSEETLIASKMLYASHYFWTALELRVLVADESRGPGFWFVTVSLSRSDGLGGILGRLIRGRVRGEVQKGILGSLTATKKKMELEQ